MVTITNTITHFVWCVIIHALLWKYLKCSRVLGIFPVAGASHFKMAKALMLELAERGHEVDVISHFPLDTKVERYNDLSIRGSLPIYTSNVTIEKVLDVGSSGYLKQVLFVFEELGKPHCRTIFNTDVFKKLRDETPRKKYDLIITHICVTDCFLITSHLFSGVPVIGLSSTVNYMWLSDRLGDEDNPSYIPFHFTEYGPQMNFLQRLDNFFASIFVKFYYNYIIMDQIKEVVKEYAGENVPDLRTIANNMSLMLINTHFTMGNARPIAPTVVEIGGVHIKPAKPLQDTTLKSIINSAKKGVIVFSLGSMIRTETFSDEIKHAFFKSFSKFPDYSIIWKGEREHFPEPIPSNIHFMKWLPQFDLICDPKTKLFITHGGIFGTQEAIYCGVPLMGIPWFADQFTNLLNYENYGIARVLRYEEMTEESITERLDDLLRTDKFYTRAKELSQLYRDRPQSAMDTAIYWIEYVIRYKGAPHLKPHSSKLWWYQRYLLDIFAFIVLTIILLVFALTKLIRLSISVLRKCIKHKNTKISPELSKKNK